MKALYAFFCVFAFATTPLFAQLPSAVKDAVPFDPKTDLGEILHQWEAANTDTALTGDFQTDTSYYSSLQLNTSDLSGNYDLFDFSSAVSTIDLTYFNASAVTVTLSGSTGTFLTLNQSTGAESQHAAAQAFFDAYKAHDRAAAQKVAFSSAIAKLAWDPASGEDPTLTLADGTHILYAGGSIELTMTNIGTGLWAISDAVVTVN